MLPILTLLGAPASRRVAKETSLVRPATLAIEDVIVSVESGGVTYDELVERVTVLETVTTSHGMMAPRDNLDPGPPVG